MCSDCRVMKCFCMIKIKSEESSYIADEEMDIVDENM